MQRFMWGGLKCSTTMDKLNKVLLQGKYLKYFCMQDTNIPRGVLGMADDTLSISNCGTEAVQTNAVINSFKEKLKLTLGKRKCEINCERKEKYWKI